jgi:hypothetical protein
MPNKRILFVDTNVFLHLRDIKDLPWRDLFSDVTFVDLMIAPRVIEELDRHKIGNNQRRRDRARLSLQLIEKASAGADFSTILKDGLVTIRLVISTAPRFDWNNHPFLDPTKPDDQLVGEALAHGNGAEIFSLDSGPRIRARVAGILAHEPPAGWLLPSEQTDDQRKIAKLERDLQQAIAGSPRIVAGFEDNGARGEEIHLPVPLLEPLAEEKAETLSEYYLKGHPPASFSSHGTAWFGFDVISGERIEGYRAEYAKFEEQVRKFFSSLHLAVGRMGCAPELAFTIKNESGTGASGLRIEFDSNGQIFLFATRKDARAKVGSLKPPAPPEVPRSVLESTYGHGLPLPNIREAIAPRDPVRFYWFERPEGTKHGAMQCEDFRATREHRGSIFLLPTAKLPVHASLNLHVSASNLSAPVSLAARVVISTQKMTWADPVVEALLPSELKSILTGVGVTAR